MKKLFSFFFIFLLGFSFFAISSSAAIQSSDGIMYRVNEDGSRGEKYTGWAALKSKGSRYYFNDGTALTGVKVFKSGAKYCFDENGVFLGKRVPGGEYEVIFENDYNISIADGVIDFKIKFNEISGDPDDYSGDPYFELFTYQDGKWKKINEVSDAHNLYDLGIGDDGTMWASQSLMIFDYDFKPGMYRVKVMVSDGEKDENNHLIDSHIIRGEFNMV